MQSLFISMPSGFITFFLRINHWIIIKIHICLWPEFKGPACLIYSSMFSLSLNGIEKYIFTFLGFFAGYINVIGAEPSCCDAP